MNKEQRTAAFKSALKMSLKYMPFVVLPAFLLSLVLGYKTGREALGRLQSERQGQIELAAKYARETATLLDTVRLSRMPGQSAPVFAKIAKNAEAAATAVAIIGESREALFFQNTAKWAESLMESNLEGHELTNDDWKMVEKIGIETGEMALAMEKGFMAIPVALDEVWPVFALSESQSGYLSNSAEISTEVGKATVARLLAGYDVESIEYVSQNQRDLPVFSYAVYLRGKTFPEISAEISSRGGYPVRFINYGKISGENYVSADMAKELAYRYLIGFGFGEMALTRQTLGEDYAAFSFVSMRDGVFCYTQQADVTVSLVNGQIIGLDSESYVKGMGEKENRQPKLPRERAIELISQQFEVKEERLAYIASSTGAEVLCYEFFGNFDGNEYYIYINADSGKQEAVKRVYTRE